ncbi:MAG: 5-formyltetrahydrofolate cyclo-ligase [Bacillota bacterium]|nr:5-formyltetrahydrofolate cyclo-ligase [Bacillota bacterium]
MTELSAERTRLRRQALAARKALPPEVRLKAGEAIAERFLALPEVQGARVIALYLALPDEVPTLPLINRLRRRDNPPLLVAPVILPERRMAMYPLPPDLSELRPGPFGVPEPPTAGCQPVPLESLEVLVVPAVAFDLEGHRLGYGAGYYDRYLAPLKVQKAVDPASPPAFPAPASGRPLLIGLAFAHQLLPAIPAADHDLEVDLIVTEAEVRRVLRA